MQLITLQGKQPRVSHRVIAKYTGYQTSSIQKLITSNKNDFEYFGTLRFKIEGVVNQGKGDQPKTYYLNEQQATLLFTYLRNNEIVRSFKKELVKAFYNLRDLHLLHVRNGYKGQLALKDKQLKEQRNEVSHARSLSNYLKAKEKELDNYYSKKDKFYQERKIKRNQFEVILHGAVMDVLRAELPTISKKITSELISQL